MHVSTVTREPQHPTEVTVRDQERPVRRIRRETVWAAQVELRFLQQEAVDLNDRRAGNSLMNQIGGMPVLDGRVASRTRDNHCRRQHPDEGQTRDRVG